VFATMAKGLHALPDIPLAPDAFTLMDCIALAPRRGPRSFFADINRVEPGQRVTVHADGRIEPVDWYDWNTPRDLGLRSDDDYVQAMRATFDTAVAACLRSDDPIGSHLSGGMDSSAVTASAALQLAQRGQRLSAYTHVPLAGARLDHWGDRTLDEGPLAALLAARHTNIDHVRVDAAERQIGDDMDAQFHAAEYPPFNLCNQVWMTEICRQMQQRRERVMLVGIMGNATISQQGVERLPLLATTGACSASPPPRSAHCSPRTCSTRSAAGSGARAPRATCSPMPRSTPHWSKIPTIARIWSSSATASICPARAARGPSPSASCATPT